MRCSPERTTATRGGTTSAAHCIGDGSGVFTVSERVREMDADTPRRFVVEAEGDKDTECVLQLNVIDVVTADAVKLVVCV